MASSLPRSRISWIVSGRMAERRIWSKERRRGVNRWPTCRSLSATMVSTSGMSPRGSATDLLPDLGGRFGLPARSEEAALGRAVHGGGAGEGTQDGTEQDAYPRGSVGPAAARRVDRKEQHAQAEHPGEHAADHDVVGPTGSAEQPHPYGDADRPAEQTEPQIGSCRQGGECAGERDMAEGVSGEDLRTEHDEVPDRSAAGRDPRSGQEGVPHELMTHDGEHPPEYRQRPDHAIASRSDAGSFLVRALSTLMLRAAT